MLCDRVLLWSVWSTQVNGKDILEFPMQVTKNQKNKKPQNQTKKKALLIRWKTNFTFD